MGVLISSQTAAKRSEPFYVEAAIPRGFIQKGLSGAEAITLEVLTSDGSYTSTGPSNSLTVSVPTITINATGWYTWNKPITASATFVDQI